MYSDFIKSHFNNPYNSGEIKDADLVFETNNPFCGDRIKFFIKLDSQKQKIENIKFKAFGCVITIALCSILSKKIEKQSIKDILNISYLDLLNEIGEIPQEKINHLTFILDFIKENLKNKFEYSKYK